MDDDARVKTAMNRAIAVLCVTELVAWGVLFYVIPVAADAMSADTGWSSASIYGAFSAGLVTSAFVGIPIGWALERRGPRLLMVAGTLGTIPGVLLMVTSQQYWQFVLSWVFLGVAMPTLFYQAAFTACAGWLGENRVKGLTAVTLAGGVASTVFAPLTSVLLDHFDWRQTWLILGAILVVVLLPLQWFFLTPPWTPVRKENTTVSVSGVVRSARFIGLSVSVTTFIFCGFAVGLTVVSLMVERGFTHTFGAIVLAIIGVGQLLGRLGFGRFSTHSGRNLRNMVIVGSMVVATMLFVVVSGPVWLLVGFGLLFGASRGAGTLMHATMIVDIWGPERYGALIGIFTMPITLAQAFAPFVGAALADAMGSYARMDTVMAIAAFVSAFGIYACTRNLDARDAGAPMRVAT